MQPETTPWKGMKTYLFSRSIDTAPANRGGDRSQPGEARKVIHGPGKDIWLFGGAELTTAFINAGMVDELWLSVHPILLGSGKPLFQGIDGRKHLKLVETKSYSTGLVSLKYTQNNSSL